jgi:hypothetical protein
MRTPDEQARVEVLARLSTRITELRLQAAEAAAESNGKLAQRYGEDADRLRRWYELERDDPEPAKTVPLVTAACDSGRHSVCGGTCRGIERTGPCECECHKETR